MSNPIIVKFSSVFKKFDGKELITDVNFELKQREITTLIGPNGAGKTTIAKLILGIEIPTSGNIFLKDSLKIGYMPQKIDFNQNLPVSAGMFLNFLGERDLNSNDSYLLNFIDFEIIKHKDIKSLSGGQLQKLLLIANILKKPELLVLDEPTKSMDITSQQEFYKLIDLIKNEYNLAIFMISHDLFTVIKSSDQVLCLNGHICCSGRPNNSPEDFKSFKSALSNIGLYHDLKR